MTKFRCKTTIFVCSNQECLTRHSAVAEYLQDECTDAMVDAAILVLENAGLPTQTNDTFADWNGGRFVQLYTQPVNHIAIFADSLTPDIGVAIDAAGDAMAAILAKYEEMSKVDETTDDEEDGE